MPERRTAWLCGEWLCGEIQDRRRTLSAAALEFDAGTAHTGGIARGLGAGGLGLICKWGFLFRGCRCRSLTVTVRNRRGSGTRLCRPCLANVLLFRCAAKFLKEQLALRGGHQCRGQVLEARQATGGEVAVRGEGLGAELAFGLETTEFGNGALERCGWRRCGHGRRLVGFGRWRSPPRDRAIRSSPAEIAEQRRRRQAAWMISKDKVCSTAPSGCRSEWKLAQNSSYWSCSPGRTRSPRE